MSPEQLGQCGAILNSVLCNQMFEDFLASVSPSVWNEAPPSE